MVLCALGDIRFLNAFTKVFIPKRLKRQPEGIAMTETHQCQFASTARTRAMRRISSQCRCVALTYTASAMALQSGFERAKAEAEAQKR